MSIEIEIIDLLKQNSLPEFDELETGDLVQVQENIFRMKSGNRSFFIKLIPNDDIYGRNEIRVNQEVLAKANIPVPCLVCVSGSEKTLLACWEELEGFDLRNRNRELLPNAFSIIGNFHALQRHTQAVYSPTTHQPFASISEMLEAEADFLCSFINNIPKRKVGSIFSLLEVGYPTFIHGDLHPGNIFYTNSGLQFVDWGYGISSLNLFDLVYIQSMSLQDSETPWWVIVPSEAGKILPDYFEACGLGGLNYMEIHKAVMLWSELGSHYNSIKNNNQTGTEVCRKNIDLLLQAAFIP